MRGVPRVPVSCKCCHKLNAAQKDEMCHSCRLRSRPNATKKYLWSEGFDSRLRDSYTRSRRREELTSSLDALQRLTGFPRFAIVARAAELNLCFAKRKVWTEAELKFMRENAGRLSIKAMAASLSRTYCSVKGKIRSLQLGGRVTDGYSVDELMRLFGVGKATVDRWIARGWLYREESRVSEKSVIRFLRAQRNAYQLSRVDEAWFKEVIFESTFRSMRRIDGPVGSSQ